MVLDIVQNLRKNRALFGNGAFLSLIPSVEDLPPQTTKFKYRSFISIRGSWRSPVGMQSLWSGALGHATAWSSQREPKVGHVELESALDPSAQPVLTNTICKLLHFSLCMNSISKKACRINWQKLDNTVRKIKNVTVFQMRYSFTAPANKVIV